LRPDPTSVAERGGEHEPARTHQIELTFGDTWLFYPEAAETRCEAALALDVDPVGLVRGKRRDQTRHMFSVG